MICKALYFPLSLLPILSLPLSPQFALSLYLEYASQFSAWFLFYIIQVSMQIAPYQRPFQTTLASTASPPI